MTPDVVLGSHTDLDDLRRAAKGATVLTFDHEHVPTTFLETLQSEGVNVQPPPSALIYAQDKTFMRRKLKSIGAPVPGFADYRTPIKRLFLCGSAAHPGGGVMGAAGWNAARVIMGKA